ncbi:methyl-accepting chemotaxis protein [Oceanirhabdus seepicola]|uniref:Methyl-accepting transducer domain-containing protein n=1 Tax=Oceanirhabdus seepicola TaxID=2828781 RepID=A0A9J6P8F6_9CLOT|nr:methyl-accepting chemotaxis protein [Oceanirhabdus seepicola]MCM1992209.1 hypothetical protein [Oceanirhabdus seepicola]
MKHIEFIKSIDSFSTKSFVFLRHSYKSKTKKNLLNEKTTIQNTFYKINCTIKNLQDSAESMYTCSNEFKEKLDINNIISHEIINEFLQIHKRIRLSAESSRYVNKNLALNIEIVEELMILSNAMKELSSSITKVFNIIAEEISYFSIEIQETHKSSKNTVNPIKSLNERKEKINFIIDLITNIAHETNLLTLNAAIETAKVSALDKKLTYIVDDIRILAEKSSELLIEVEEILKDIKIRFLERG